MLKRLAMCLALPAMLLAAGVMEARAQEFTVGELIYVSTDSGKASVCGYLGDGGHVVIPERVLYDTHTYEIMSIGAGAFEGCTSLTSIDLPDGLTSIEEGAFWGCVGLTSVTFPESLTSIGDSAFKDCTSLVSVDFPEKLNGWMSIGSSAFYSSGLTSIVLPEGLDSIGVSAFENSTLDSVVFPESLTSIGYMAFRNSGLTSVVFSEGLTSIGAGAFWGCSGLTSSLEFPASLESIGDRAFYGCEGLISISFREGLTSIGDLAFLECNGLTSIEFPASLTSIGYGAFTHCDDLTILDFPTGLKKIESFAFSTCRSLISLDFPEGLESIGEQAFYGCTGLTSVAFPASLESIGQAAFMYCDGLTSIDFPEKLNDRMSIGPSAFNGCYRLTYVAFPEGLASIGDGAFNDCHRLTSVAFPDGLTSIDVYAFFGCTGLTSVAFPASLESIGQGAFKDCTSLTSVVFPESLTSIGTIGTEEAFIGGGAFEGCTGLISIDLPDDCKSIGNRTFYGCTSLTTVGMPANLSEVGDDSFPESVSAIIYRGGDYDVAALFSRQLDCIVAFDSLGGDDIHSISKGGCEVFWFTDADLPSRSYDSGTKVYTFKKDGYPVGFKFVSLGISVSGTYTYTGESHSLYIDGNTSSSEMELLNGIDIIDAGDYNIDEVAFSFRNDSRRIYIPEVRVSIDEPLHFVIEQAPLGVSVSPSHVSMTYGERRPDFEVVYDGFLGDDDESSISVIPSVECASAEYPVAGTYPVTVSGGEARNYYFEYADGELTVGKAELTVTGKSYTVAYGDELPDFGYDIEGFVLGDDEGDLSALPSVSPLSDPAVGDHSLPITGGEADNYSFSYRPGTLTVLKAAQTIDWPQDFTSGLSQGDMVEITATATSGLGITYESTNVDVAEIIHIDGRPYLSCVNDGSANIIATQPGDGNHEAAPSVTRCVNVGHGSGLAPSASSPSVGCRPSPARDVLEVTGTDASMTAAVYSPSGAMVLSSRCADGMTRIDVSRLDAGTYILVVSGGDGATARLRFAKE